MEAVIGRGHYRRDRGAFPPFRQVNMFLEETATDPNRYNVLSRPPLVGFYEWGTGPIHGVYSKEGLESGALFAVSGDRLYKNGLLVIGPSIDGTGPVSWAGGNAQLVFTRGATAYCYSSASNVCTAIPFPDGADVAAVNWMARRFYYIRKGTGRFYWSALDDAPNIDALAFATAEGEPDALLDIKKSGDVFWMLGSSTGEAWVLTGDPDLPLTRVVQRTLPNGVQDTGCACEIGGTIYYISSDGMVCSVSDQMQRVSDGSLEERIRTSTTGIAFSFTFEGKTVFCMRLDSGTFGIDITVGNQPMELQTYGRVNWAPKCAVNIGSAPFFGDAGDNIIYVFDTTFTASTDCGVAQFPRIFSAGVPSSEQPLPISNVIVDGNTGSTPISDPNLAAEDPKLEMRFTRDGGRTWSDWRPTRWGKMGEYQRKARFGGCGSFNPPGWLAEFRMIECVPLRIAKVRVNESLAGRGH